MAQTPIESPCINICKLDPTGRLCTGCGRTLDEIAHWRDLTPAERRAIMERLRQTNGQRR